MSERKAINKYYPPDWDPSQAPKKRKNKNPNAEKVRLMLPFSMKCLQCNEYIALRRKFNARKEVTAEKYMGIKIIRFHIKCPRCNNGIVFRTDPKSAGFAPVEGGVRNYESLVTDTKIKPLETEDEIFERLEREESENQKFQEKKDKRKRNPFWQNKELEDKNVMESLEDKLIEQQQEQEMHDHLEYLQAKALRLQQSGGSDQVTRVLQDQVAQELADRKRRHEDQVLKTAKLKNGTVSTSKPLEVSGLITVKRPRTVLHENSTSARSINFSNSTNSTPNSPAKHTINSSTNCPSNGASTMHATGSSAVLALAGYTSSDEE